MYNVEKLSKNYKQGNVIIKVLDEFNLRINSEEFLCIMGSSGSGKTTLIKILSMIEEFDAGEIYFNNRSFKEFSEKEKDKYRKKNIGIVFQSYNLIDEMTIEENIKLGSILSDKKAEIEYKDIISMLNIDELVDKYPNQLSGGEKQRVAVARCLNKKVDCIFADEPTGALNRKNSKKLMEIFKDLNKKYKKTIVMVTHDPFVASYSDRLVYLKDGKIAFEAFKKNREQEYYEDILKCLEVYDG
ncbi:TPA: ABC transporter ATP-binding protein [Streptococcus agalactiae]|uniref:ABC transporter ATP-binding protein n=1 Tax=Finegoldia magna TaxID=1260 RepID=UPI002B3C90A5|nr:ABC transporter ATP-binding protein [Streptococcus pyogenes]